MNRFGQRLMCSQLIKCSHQDFTRRLSDAIFNFLLLWMSNFKECRKCLHRFLNGTSTITSKNVYNVYLPGGQ